jgi:Holliday junction resolvasome RuvABC DNA-binding subunit
MSAKQVFGRDAVERQIDFRQQKSMPSEVDPAEQKRQKLLAALLAQGFKKTESKNAIAKLARDATTLSLEQLIRGALDLLVVR